jgi:tRNA threonylcarbamoyladenosine biosynthesis protein TsaE
MLTLEIESLQQIDTVARDFLEVLKGHKKFAFTGAMGSGKTTFINAVCRKLGAVHGVTSPTFALVNEYRTLSDECIYHFDLYRILTVEEMYDLGYEEYFFSDAWCFVEWAEKAEEILTEEFIHVNIKADVNNKRILQIHIP